MQYSMAFYFYTFAGLMRFALKRVYFISADIKDETTPPFKFQHV